MWFRRTPQKIVDQENPRLAVNELVARIGKRRAFDQLSWPEQVLVLVNNLQTETLNGTVDQYLSNSSGDMLLDAVKALDEIGASESRAILSEVVGWFPDGNPSTDRRTRCEQLEQLRDVLPDYETKIRDVTDRLSDTFPQMRDCLVTYLRAHVGDIR